MKVAGTWLRAAADQVDVICVYWYALMVTSWVLVVGAGGDWDDYGCQYNG